MEANTRARLHFTVTEWDAAKAGMKELLKQKDKIIESVYEKISDIYKNVFSKGITFGSDEFDDESKQSYCDFDKVMFCLLSNYFHLFVVSFCFFYGLIDHYHKTFRLQNKTNNHVSQSKLGSIGHKILFKHTRGCPNQTTTKFITITMGRSIIRLFIN